MLDVPEDNILLDWDADLNSQPKDILPAIKNVIETANNLLAYIADGYTDDEEFDEVEKALYNAKTGEDLYEAVTSVMNLYVDYTTPKDGVINPQKRTSLLFNKFGISGLRYLDGGSRDEGEGTRNFVIWNEDAMQVLGLTPDSDQDAIDYFEQYRREHPDGFIIPEAIERFDQLVTHATGNIILGNRFDLRYVGSSEGGDMFGYGAYFEQSPEVAKNYRRFGLKNMGFDKIDVRLSNGIVLSLKDIKQQLNDLRYNPEASIKLPAGVSNSALADAVKELIYTKINSTSWDFSKAIKQLIHDVEHDADEAMRNRRANFSNELRATAKALRAIKDIEFFGEKRGNIYQFDIPEDYELLDWDADLKHQSKDITPIVKRIVRAIQTHPEKFLAMGLAKTFKDQKTMQAKLLPLVSALAQKIKGDELEGGVHDWEKITEAKFASMPEYEQLGRLVGKDKRYDAILKLYDYLNDEMITLSDTGGELYNKLTDLMYFGDVRNGTYQEESRAAKVAASMYLNSKGISGHRFLDRGSRDSGEGTRNFVIWNMGRVKMIGIDPSSDQEAIDYYNRTKRMQDLLAQADAVYANEHLISPAQIEHYDQLAYHGTGHIIHGNKFDLQYVGTGATNGNDLVYGYGAYFAADIEEARIWRHSGIHSSLFEPAQISIRTKNNQVFTTRSDYDDDGGYTSANWDNQPSDAFLGYVLNEIYSLFRQYQDISDIKSLKKSMAKRYQDELAEIRANITDSRQKEIFREDIQEIKAQLKALRSIKEISVIPSRTRKGNVYTFNIPDNNELLDWNKHITEQPEMIKQVRREILQELKRHGFDFISVKKAKTGGEFYRALVNIMNADRGFAYPHKEIIDPQQRASLILLQHGVPGLHYLNSSENANGSHCYVIWDIDKVQMLGVEGDTEAEQYFRDTQARPNASETYNQSARTTDEFTLTPEAQRQMDEVRRKYEGTPQWMKAPNGKPTKLNEHQWLAVRTPNFIKWFGDWLKDPEHASKVVDENGEPLVVYRGVNGGRLSKDGTLPGILKGIPAWQNEPGSFFTSNYQAARTYTRTNADHIIRPTLMTDNDLIYAIFVNIRNPYVFEGNGEYWDRLEEHIVITDKKNNILHSDFKDYQEAKRFFDEHYIGAELKEAVDRVYEHEAEIADALDEDVINRRVEELRQIAEEEEEEEFDEDAARERLEQEEIDRQLSPKEKELLVQYWQIRKQYRVTSYYLGTDEIVRAVVNGLRGVAPNGEEYDGVIFRNIYDVIDVNVNYVTKDKNELFSDVIVPLHHNNMKSATRNNGNFDGSERDVYHQIIGMNGALALDRAEGVTWRMDNLREAKKMTKEGKEAIAIKRSTGWEVWHDGKWKMEIDDGIFNREPFRAKYDAPETEETIRISKEIDRLEKKRDSTPYKYNENTGSWRHAPILSSEEQNTLIQLKDKLSSMLDTYLPEVYDNPALYLAYPQLKNIIYIELDNLRNAAKGEFIAHKNKAWEIHLASYLDDRQARFVLIHEIQHAIQRLEGAPSQGTNIIKQGYDVYKREAIEVEARNAATRANFSDDEAKNVERRRNTLLSETEDVSPDDIEIDIQEAEYEKQLADPFGDFDERADSLYSEYLDSLDNNSSFVDYTGRDYERSISTYANDMLNDREDDGFSEVYHQAMMRLDTFTLTPEASRQMNAVYKQYAGTPQWLKAPNGQPTKLTKQQWLAVRTPNFIHWFGDWLHDPEHASKVLDENGEPRVVYHGTDTEEISIFNTKGQDRTKGSGAFFIGSEEVANTYVRRSLSPNKIYPVFLNIRNPYVLDGGNRYWSTLLEYHVYDKARDRNIFIKNDGTNFTSREDAENYIRNVLNNPERYSVGEGNIMTTDEIARFVWKFRKGNEKRFDGIIIRNILDVGTPPTRAFNPISDEFIIPKPEQVKSASRNNGEYSPSNPDHYHQASPAIAHNVLNVSSTPANFVSDELVEVFNQPSYQGTGHIIKNNRMSLDYVGSGEGTQSFGYGIYSAQSKKVAEHYRRYGLRETELERYLLNNSHIQDLSDTELQALEQLYSLVAHGKASGTHEELNTIINDAVQFVVQRLQDNIKGYEQCIKRWTEILDPEDDILDDLEQRISAAQDAILFIQNDVDMSKFTGRLRIGNIYELDVPEDYELLDWDADLHRQPEQIQNILRRLMRNFDRVHMTGEKFYQWLAERLGSQKKASMWLLKYGIPGLRYLDGFSRNARYAKNGTHNFVIWDMSRIHITGIDQSSDQDAIEYFERTRNNESSSGESRAETYHQIIGQNGAAALDKAEGTTQRLDALGKAQELDKSGVPDAEIWRNTGEVEARNVQARIDLDEEARIRTPLTATEDYKRSEQIRSKSKRNDFITPEQIERFEQLMYHGSPNIILGNKFDLRYLGTGEGTQVEGYGIYLAQNPNVSDTYGAEYDGIIFKDKNGRPLTEEDFRNELTYASYDLMSVLQVSEITPYMNKLIQDVKQTIDLPKAEINDAVEQIIDSTVQDIVSEFKIPQYRDMIYRTLEPRMPIDVYHAKYGKKLYIVDGPEDYELLDWDATMSEQSGHVLEKLKSIGLYRDDYETGQQLYKRLSRDFGGGKEGDRLASMALNDAGIHGHRYWDAWSRTKKEGTHNFVIWNTDTLRLLGLTDDSDEDAQEYYKAEDYYRGYLDSLDNDSDFVDYDSEDYERSINTYANGSLDALEYDGFGEVYRQPKLVTPAHLEQYNQLVTHATGNVIYFNRFDLRYVGSSEGGDAFGYGAYFEEAPEAAEHYRRYGLDNDDTAGRLKIFTRDGASFNAKDEKSWQHISSDKQIALGLVKDIHKFLYEHKDADFEAVKAHLRDKYNGSLKVSILYIQYDLDDIKTLDTTSPNYQSRRDRLEASIAHTQETMKHTEAMLQTLDNIKNAQLSKVYKGNIYQFDIPENYELLDWDATLDEQSEQVKKGVNKLYSILRRRGFDKQELNESFSQYRAIETGEDLYWAVANAMKYLIRAKGKLRGGITDYKQAASMLFLKAGIPGHKYLDAWSRDAGEGTHNFVIWDESKIKMMRIDPSSDELAKKIFENGGDPQMRLFDDNGEVFHQTARADAFSLSPEAQKQIDEVRRKYEGTPQWMKAPNGKNTKLSERLWLAVRTQNFKAWFGDWENNPVEASKVLDENGEPLVVYHGTKVGNRFSVFDTINGAWFSNTRNTSDSYINGFTDSDYDNATYGVFLNIKNPMIIDYEGKGALDDGNEQPSYWLENSYGHDGVICLNIKDRGGRFGGYAEQDENGNYIEFYDDVVYGVKNPEQIKSATDNNGNFDASDPDIYHQITNSPLVERYSQLDTFGNPDTEQKYSGSFSTQGGKAGILQPLKDILHGFRGDFPELAVDSRFIYAREVLREMGRKSDAKVLLAVKGLVQSVEGLNARQLNIFGRFMLLDDIETFRMQNPNASLPMGFTLQSFLDERKRFADLANSDNAIMKALRSEHSLHEQINNALASYAEKLGLPALADKVRHNDFYILEYSKMLKGQDINANYLQAVADTRAQQLRDFEHMTALLKLKAKHDIKRALIEKFGEDWRRHIPKGYRTFSPLTGHFIMSAHTLTENVLGASLEQLGQTLGLSEQTMKALRSSVADNSGSHIMVLPDALADTLEALAVPKVRGAFGKITKAITTQWKKWMLFFPTRACKYNVRNITGDLDAVIAGNPHALVYLPQAFKELCELYYGSGKASNELFEFQKRGGAITIQSTQELGEYKQLKEFAKLMDELQGKDASAWAKLPRKVWKLIDKLAWSGIQNFSDFREQWLRYACYLDYMNQMQDNEEHMPKNWGASVKEEVLSIPAKNDNGIRDRAFKMSNELLGAYDQVSQTGKAMRDIFWPFYSWVEVNAKRYYRLIKNGITEYGLGDFASRFLKGQLLNLPYYGFKLAKMYLLINLLSMLFAAFNNLVWPDDEDKLPPDVKSRPHITLGHDTKGNVLYFDRVGAMLDNLEWFGQESSPFVPFAHDVRDIFDGRMTFTGFISKLATSPINKVSQGISPLIKTPFEMMAGKSLYPDITHPRNIRDYGQYLAQSFGLSWPYKALSGQPLNNWKEFKNLFTYQADAEEVAYFYTLGLVRQFEEKVLGKSTGSFGLTKRGQVLQKMKTAMRLGLKDEVRRYLQEYYKLGGNQKGLKASMRNMNPLHGLNKQEQAQFLKWITPEERKYLNRANAFFHRMADSFLR